MKQYNAKNQINNMPLIPEILNERKLWVIISTRKRDGIRKELEIIRPMVEKLNEQWFEKGDFIWAGSFDDKKTSMAIFEAVEDKARKYFDNYSKICLDSLDSNIYQWDALPLFTILQRIQGEL